MNPGLTILLAMLIGSQLVINFFLGQLIITLKIHFSLKTKILQEAARKVNDEGL